MQISHAHHAAGLWPMILADLHVGTRAEFGLTVIVEASSAAISGERQSSIWLFWVCCKHFSFWPADKLSKPGTCVSEPAPRALSRTSTPYKARTVRGKMAVVGDGLIRSLVPMIGEARRKVS